MTTQREYEKRFWAFLAGELANMDFDEIAQMVDVDPETVSDAVADRIERAQARVSDMCLTRSM